MSAADQDEPAPKSEQLEQVKTEIQAKLEASRMEWTRAIRDGHSSSREFPAFMDNYEVSVTVCATCSLKNGSLNGNSRPNQNFKLFIREKVRRITMNSVVGLHQRLFFRIFQETFRPSYRLGKDMRDRKDNRLCFHDKSAVLSVRVSK
jgi:hypothetical protein